MEEKEVIQYLKDNMKKGTSFHFMPKEVQDWVIKNYRDCAYLNDDGIWDRATSHVSDINDIWASDVYALIEGYEPKPEEPEAEWAEFYINKGGEAEIIDDDPTNPYLCDWYDWIGILNESCRLDWGLIAFGGWQYEGDSYWYMSPQVIANGQCYVQYSKNDNEVKGVVPKKIRFWRIKSKCNQL